MVAKQAVRQQQDTSRPAQEGELLAGLRPIADAFNAAVAQCVANENQDAVPEAVHRLRTGSRRLQATLEAMLRAVNPVSDTFERAATAWLRQLKKTRRAAGVVRDLDVQCKLLAEWMETKPAEDHATLLQKQTEALAATLKAERRRQAHGMQKQIKKRQQRLLQRQEALFAAVAGIELRGRKTSPTADAVALADFVRAAASMPLLHAENLHDFRKATKKARYVAEGGQKSSAVAGALKRVQDAIGEWHDWRCLAEQAKDSLVLMAALQREAERHLTTAVKTTETMRGRLLGEWTASEALIKRSPTSAVLPNGMRKRA